MSILYLGLVFAEGNSDNRFEAELQEMIAGIANNMLDNLKNSIIFSYFM